MRPKPSPPTRAEIDDDLAASLQALGLRADAASEGKQSAGDRVLAAYRATIAELGRPVTSVEVGRRIGLTNSRVSVVAADLASAGRMIRATDPTTGKVVYVPKAGA